VSAKETPHNASTDADAQRDGERVGAAPVDSGTTGGAARNALYEAIGVALLNAGVQQPASEFVAAVRAAAGFRVAPRQVAAAVDELGRAGQLVDVATVAALVKGVRGPAAERQRRHADDWRALGAALALRGLDGTPEGQRAFVGAARQAAGPLATDSLLLTVALTIAGEGRALLAPTVGAVAKRIARSAPDLTSAEIVSLTQSELRALDRPRRQLPPKRRSSSAARRPAPPGRQQTDVRTHKPGKRRWAPGGRRRRTIKFPEQRGE
jgi:hypothetical protein